MCSSSDTITKYNTALIINSNFLSVTGDGYPQKWKPGTILTGFRNTIRTQNCNSVRTGIIIEGFFKELELRLPWNIGRIWRAQDSGAVENVNREVRTMDRVEMGQGKSACSLRSREESWEARWGFMMRILKSRIRRSRFDVEIGNQDQWSV